MRKINFLFVIVLLFSLLGCTASSETSTDLPYSTQTNTLIPTSTPKPATPTVTPFPPLQTNGPYFSYFRKVDEEYQLVLLDVDGKGRKEIPLPTEVSDSLLNEPDIYHVSPDGKWFAFYTGWAGSSDMLPSEGKFDLTLNLFNFSTGKTQIVTPLLSKDYPNNFSEAANRLNDPSITNIMLYYAFLNGITKSLAWSPDGKYLAFAGQMDGLSSNLYVYEVEAESISRLSSGDKQIQSIEWSSDSKWVLYSTTQVFGMGMEFDIYSASLDGKSVNYLSTASSNFRSWIDTNTYLEHDSENVYGDFGLRLVDIDSGFSRKIWDGPVINFGLNTEKKKLVFITHLFSHSPYLSTEPEPDFSPSIYLFDLETFETTNLEFPEGFNFFNYSFIDSFNLENDLFVFTSTNNQKPYFLSEAENFTEINIDEANRVINSHNLDYWIVVKNESIDLYSKNNMLIKNIELPFRDAPIGLFIWKPDSTGLFAIHEFNIYSINILTSEVVLLESDLVRRLFSFGARWITEK